jgi:hypothetical protein
MRRALLLLAVTAASAWPCSMTAPTPREAFRRTGFAVQATIRKVEYLEPAREVPIFEGSRRLRSVPRRFRATLEVSAVWKGQVGRELVLHARQDGSDCVGFTDQVGTEMILFGGTATLTPPESGTLRIPEWIDLFPAGTVLSLPGFSWSTVDSPEHRELLRVLGKPKVRYSTTD